MYIYEFSDDVFWIVNMKRVHILIVFTLLLQISFGALGMDPANLFSCNMCAYATDQFINFQKHYVRRHKHDPHFNIACCIDTCCYATNKWGNYRVHVHRKHPAIVHTENQADVLNDEEENNVEAQDQCDVDPRSYNASFTLSLETKHNMCQSAIDDVISSMDTLIQKHIEYNRAQVKSVLSDLDVDPAIIDGIPLETFLDEFDSNARRKAYYQKNVVTHIQPQEVILGSKYVNKSGIIKRVQMRGYIVPFKENIRNLLHMPEIFDFVRHPYVSKTEFMYDVCDGNEVKSIDLFSTNPSALQIILNCDDLEIVNPLGSKIQKKHKVCVFYYTLGNIPPEYRSKLHSIQLLAICKSKDIRRPQAEEKLLSDFINTINQMSSAGIEIDVNGTIHNVKGALVILTADTLASNWIGKFKEGVSFAMRNCRRCEVESREIHLKVSERQVALRNLNEHREHCRVLSELTTQAKQYWSKIWGVNGASCLLNISECNILKCLVQDPMHVLLEGVFPHELKQLLYHMIYTKSYFTLKWFNSALSGFPYSYLHRSATPAVFEKKNI